jgi:hypothetical protein
MRHEIAAGATRPRNDTVEPLRSPSSHSNIQFSVASFRDSAIPGCFDDELPPELSTVSSIRRSRPGVSSPRCAPPEPMTSCRRTIVIASEAKQSRRACGTRLPRALRALAITGSAACATHHLTTSFRSPWLRFGIRQLPDAFTMSCHQSLALLRPYAVDTRAHRHRAAYRGSLWQAAVGPLSLRAPGSALRAVRVQAPRSNLGHAARDCRGRYAPSQ